MHSVTWNRFPVKICDWFFACLTCDVKLLECRCVVVSDVAKSVTFETWLKVRDRPRLHQKLRDRDLKFETETRDFKICGFCRNFLKNVVITSDLNFFNFWQFPTNFGCFLPENTTNKKSLKYRNFNKPFHCNIQSLETWNLRDQDETWNLRDRDRDSQKWVSRPSLGVSRPSLETPSLVVVWIIAKKW